MFQPSINENVYRALQQRLDSIERNVRDETSLEELRRASNLLREVNNNINSLQTALSVESWDRINRDRATLDRYIAERIVLTENTQDRTPTRPSEEDDRDINEPNAREVGRPKKGIEINKLQSLLNMGFNISEIAKKDLLGFKDLLGYKFHEKRKTSRF